MTDFDIIIVGGGFAGATVARELAGSGQSVALLDARDRLGGRAWCQDWQGYPIEMGGGWVNGSQPHVWAEITRYGLSLFERPGWLKRADALMHVRVGEETVSRPTAEVREALMPLIEAFAADARAVYPRPYDPAFAMEAVRALDHLSAQDRLNEMALPPLEHALMSRMLSMQSHGHPETGAYVEFLRWFALSHFSMEVYASTTSRLQFDGGTGQLIEAIIEDSEADVMLNWPVASVAQTASGVTVTHADGTTLTGKQAVIATPVNVWKHIDFSPALSAEKAALTREEHTGKGHKLYVRIKGHWPDLGLAGGADADVCTVIVQEARADETLLVMMLANSQLAPFSQDQVEAALQAFVPEIEVIDMIFHNWVDDSFALGTWCGYRPGQTSGYLLQAQEAEGRLYFAGGDIASGWRGFFDGAIESGLRAACQLKRDLAN